MKQYILKDAGLPPAAKIDYKKELNPQQLEVVASADGPCLVLAGAGSGKTRTLVYRLAYLLEKGVGPGSILLVTFTNRAAHQMRNRIEALLKMSPKDIWWGTFHHIGNRALRMYGSHIGINNDFAILDEEDSLTLLKTAARSLSLYNKDKFFPKPAVLQAIISYARNSKKDIRGALENRYPDFLEFHQEVSNIHGRYTAKKKDANSLDYDDLLTEWLRLLKQSEEARGKLAGRFKYILVDEYQDTNRLQFEIIKLLSQAHGNILVVGDDAQSIYSFRAADINNILDFPKHFPGTKIYKLEINYRSTPQILNLANKSIKQNIQQFKKELQSSKPEGEAPALIKVADLRKQAALVAQRALELYQDGEPLENIAVLFRAHYQSVELEMELIKRGIPYIMRGGLKFFQQAHIKDVLSYLRIAHNPFDQVAWMRALILQQGVGPVYAEKVYQKFASDVKILKGIFNKEHWRFLPKKPALGFAGFLNTMYNMLKEDASGSPYIMIEAVLENGYRNYCVTNFENSSDRLEDLKELVGLAHTYKGLRQFLADASLGEGYKGETIIEPAAQAGEHLVLSTIHQAKGLEWDVVFLIGLIDNQFPHPKAEDDPAQMEEERRLFYVAVTRAKRHLYLLRPMTKYDYNYGSVIARPSLFLEELDKDCYEEWEVEEPYSE